ncbi:MAG: ATP-binding protein [Candidatus Pacebacteria bacterium]|nr:ATP-binding protein [Candidatus Paceibacterota bacterium]
MVSQTTKIKYLNQPEFRPALYLTPLAVVVAILDGIYGQGILRVVAPAIIVVIISILLGLSLKLTRASVELRTKTQQVESVFTNLANGVIAYDQSFKILIFNKAAQEIFRLQENQVIGKVITAAMASDPALRTLAQVIFSSLAPVVVKHSDPGMYPQVVDISFDNPKLELRVITDRVIESDESPGGFVKIITDKTREAQLLKSKTDFITVAAHQLRTPLTAVNWTFEALEREESLAPQQKELVNTGFLAAKKMLKTVNDLLDISKIEEGKFGYQFEEKDIISFVEEVLVQINDTAKQYGIKLYFNRPQEALPRVYIDPQKLSMAFFNLLDNAIKYNVENGTVTVSIEKEDKSFIRISIKDTGIGVSKEELEKLFTKFFRAENAVKTMSDGSGLGLYITKNIIERHGGRIWAESEINRGSVFYLTLPTDPQLIPKKELTETE